jgi:hypothetical protein
MKYRLITVLLLGLSLGGCAGQVSVYRHSADFSTQIIYLGKKIAIGKVTEVEAFDKARTLFSIGKAHWESDPELARDTGDRFDSEIGENPQKVGISGDNKWLIVEDKKYNESKEKYENVIYAVSLDAGESWAATDVESLEKNLNVTTNMRSIRTEPIEIFFDRMLVAYFDSKNKAATNNTAKPDSRN